ncbi:IclR family transcriptional regulator [Williamsia sp. CHRR-6]|uniref:IclR family transcriptional regulator n=1 Tax=Williamsia sp. CHRR-6 TaxID=2835871 RepID=UPI001BD9E5E6|nr:IclR family transcriptional regulator [Williamsia sp. CHRR-6]MBT0566033.1 IclR family transcriptional regulator [Williamsia sp. CHRR-6]
MREIKTPPAYVVTSVDHALRIAVMLQMEGALTVSEVAQRLGVARSTAHRLLSTLVFRDFAEQDDRRRYRPGRVLALAHHSYVETSRLRTVALPTMLELMEVLGETVNLTVRVGVSVRFAASVECAAALRVTSREGMAFPAHLTSGGMVLLAALDPTEVHELYTAAPADPEELAERPDPTRLQGELAKVRRAGFALNSERSERGIVAVGVAVRGADGPVAGLAVAMPSVRYDRHRLPWLVERLRRAAAQIEGHLTETS